MTESIQLHYQTLHYPQTTSTSIREYLTPAQYFDPRKEILSREMADYKNKPRQKKFKSTFKHKASYFDEIVAPYSLHPSPHEYKTLTNGFFGDPSKDSKTGRSKSASHLHKVNLKLKRGTYIDDIENHQKKHKAPAVGKYDITKDPYKKKVVNLKPKDPQIKRNTLDDVVYLSNFNPGSGQYNPHLSVSKTKNDQTTPKFYKTKHKEEEEKRRSLSSTKLGPSTYTPVVADTFDSIAKKDKLRERSRWSHGEIDKRKGETSRFKSPSPAEYKLINQWDSPDKRVRETSLGKVKLFSRLSSSVKSLSVYH